MFLQEILQEVRNYFARCYDVAHSHYGPAPDVFTPTTPTLINLGETDMKFFGQLCAVAVLTTAFTSSTFGGVMMTGVGPDDPPKQTSVLVTPGDEEPSLESVIVLTLDITQSILSMF
ncbi:MAG TPA: hypothetical protein VM934_02750 [Pyrinomonadaceae bacterium]|jgi:hypothetical protein|nr:hypothetical protein [Pyrinomonadaceae bacterium]